METGSRQGFPVREVRQNRHGVRREQKAALAQEDTRLRKQAVLGDGYLEAVEDPLTTIGASIKIVRGAIDGFLIL